MGSKSGLRETLVSFPFKDAPPMTSQVIAKKRVWGRGKRERWQPKDKIQVGESNGHLSFGFTPFVSIGPAQDKKRFGFEEPGEREGMGIVLKTHKIIGTRGERDALRLRPK